MTDSQTAHAFGRSDYHLFAGAALTALALSLIAAPALLAGDILWSSSGGSAWLTNTNWTGNAVPTATDNAQFGANPTAATGVGINFSNVTNAGTQTNGNRIEDAGAIEVTSARAAAFLVGNSSSTAGASGTLRLFGTTVNGVANTILRNNSAQSFTIQNVQGSGTQTMALALGSATGVVNVDSTGNIVVSSNISGTGSALSLNAASTGDLRFSGTNTYDGGTTINGGTGGGRLRIDAVSALPTSGTVAVATGGRITLNAAGTYGGVAQSLTFNPNQTANPAFDIASNAAVTWQGTLAINADARLEANGASGSVTFSGNYSGAGTLIKQASGSLTLSGTGNTATGGTQVGNGLVTVGSGSKLGTGALSLFQTSTNNTAVTLNNAAQTIGPLSSQFTAATGTQTQAITLNGTALSINQSANTSFGVGAVATLTSTIAGTGSISLAGTSTGALTLTGANTYGGGTTIAGGKLLVANTTGSATGSGPVSIGAGGTLASGAGASGIITGLVSTAGAASTIAPGATAAANVGTVDHSP